ncbi:MAG: RimK protein ATP-grasp [Deltaproteobacteria bacterium]|jgi:ribosomal protein S6--L-glutamate ligase|nr:RimK protein ATP-grasp [Deltaproteobacteria bacterium]
MILSFHPCIHGDENVIVAGRGPTPAEEALVRRADAIILPQGVREDLYDMCRRHCGRLFPDYDCRFAYPGKLGDIRLFRALGIPHPESLLFSDVADYRRRYPLERGVFPFRPPFIIKGNTGGEGNLVFRIHQPDQLEEILAIFAGMETSGFLGFLAQELIDHGGRDLRVVALHDQVFSYWRVQHDPAQFLTNLSAGGAIDAQSDRHLRRRAEALVRHLSQKSGINLAGIDLMFDAQERDAEPLMVEINYWFGRRFFGSSRVYYRHLLEAIQRWLGGFDRSWPNRVRVDGEA